MSVKKRKLSSGKLTSHYYYRFKINGQEYKGSTYKTDLQEALAYEQSIKADLKSMLRADDSADRIRKKNLVHFRDKITAQVQGESIALDDIWSVFRKKAPARMKTIPSEKIWKEKEGRWNDFLAFLKSEHPGCISMRDVSSSIAEEYVSLIKTSGKFQKTISYSGLSYQSKAVQLSASTINKYINDMTQVFRILSTEAGLLENPFEKVEIAKGNSEKRDVFELHELEKIQSFLDERKSQSGLSSEDRKDFIITEAIFTIGINSGLRKADISLLKWDEVDFHKKAIERVTRKTGEKVFIPLTEKLFDFLFEKQRKAEGAFVTPELAEMYRNNEEGISYRFKKMLNSLGIETLKSQEGRSRKISVKDIHSLRHTFCYLHGIQGTPLVVVQSMVGHMDRKMTEAYMMHQTEELKREAVERFSLKPFKYISLSPVSDTRKKLISLIENCDSEDVLEEVLGHFKREVQVKDRGISEGGSSFKM
ncbi:MAG: tyrosine-type recombinase/integrase [Lentisphaeraceae bacterium]|nr:tyrosine-type recombinase/integrase [Lentisphaeraceae bacterium]